MHMTYMPTDVTLSAALSCTDSDFQHFSAVYAENRERNISPRHTSTTLALSAHPLRLQLNVHSVSAWWAQVRSHLVGTSHQLEHMYNFGDYVLRLHET